MPTGEVSAGRDIERVVVRLRPHGRVLFWPSVMLILVVGAIGYFGGSFDEEWQNNAVMYGGIAVIVLFWLLPLLAWLSKHYTITTRRIVIRRGFFVRVRQELLHSRGYDIAVRKNSLQSMVGSGDVLVNTGLDRPVVLHDVPNADLVQSVLQDLMENSLNPIAARRQAEASSVNDDTVVWGDR